MMKVPKARAKIIAYKSFNVEGFINEMSGINWDEVCCEDDPEVALDLFMLRYMSIADKHAPLKKFTVRNKSALWIDSSLRIL